MIGEKSEKSILKKEIRKQLKETHYAILKHAEMEAQKNREIMLEKMKELEEITRQTIKEEVACQIKSLG